jgi:hypothetical integral membrane protein (TIGR02206 family)
MEHNFRLFGPSHLLILASAPAGAALLATVCRRCPGCARNVRYGLAFFLTVNELIWYSYRLYYEGFRFPEGLPLNLCDLTLWVTVWAVFTVDPLAFEIAYFAGLGGSGMAVLTPDLWAPFPSYPTVYFFLAHGTVIAAILTLVWSDMIVPRPGCVWRVFGVLNGYVAAAGTFNAIFGTNYIYLCRKPTGASLLDYFGPWPFYLVGGEIVAVTIFWLLWLPFRNRIPAFGNRHGTQASPLV